MLSYYALQLVVACVVLAVAARALSVAFRRYPRLELLLRQLFLTRYSLLTALLLVGLWPLSRYAAPDLLANLFVLRGPPALVPVALASVLTAATALITARVTLENAPRRFVDYRRLLRRVRGPSVGPPAGGAAPGGGWGAANWAWLFLLGLPVPVFCLVETYQDTQGERGPSHVLGLAACLAGGVVLALAWLGLTAALQQWVLPRPSLADRLLPFESASRGLRGKRPERPAGLNARLAALLARLGPGYRDPGSPWLTPGHAQGFLYMGFTLLAYLLFFLPAFAGWPAVDAVLRSLWLSPLFFALLLLMILGFALTSLAFALDYYRVPALPAVAAFSFALFWVNDTDHFYDPNPASPGGPSALTWVLLGLAGLALLAYLWARARGPAAWPAGVQLGAVAALVLADAVAAYFGWLVEWHGSPPGGGWGPGALFLSLGLLTALAWGGFRLLAPDQVTPPRVLLAGAVAFGLCAAASLVPPGGWGAAAGGPAAPDPPRLADLFPDKDGQEKGGYLPIPAGKDGRRTLVVVTASGGGVQATAWTDRVLAGLHELYGPDFSRSVRLVSAVSGGSLGAAYYLKAWQPEEKDPLPDDPGRPGAGLRGLREKVRRSNLEATSWGMAYPDLLRLYFPPLVPDHMDRGWALEEFWRDGLGDWTLADMAGPVRRGRMPAVVFNATLAETGQRLLVAPVFGRAADPAARDRGYFLRPPGAVEYLDLYGADGPRLRVATAVRLSATFSFVSPMPRARRRPDPPTDRRWDALTHDHPEVLEGSNAAGEARRAWQEAEGLREYLRNCHVVDGGYVDNEGAFTAAEWSELILRGLKFGEQDVPHFDRVLFVRIMPFPPEQAHGKGPGDWAPGKVGWLNEFTGPVVALENVRGTSQAERNSFGLGLLGASAPWGAGPPADAPAGCARVLKVQFVFQLFAQDDPPAPPAADTPREGQVTPLTWSLTRQQYRDIDRAWEQLCRRAGQENNPLGVLDRLFRRKSPAGG
jgi:hypothetical protein